MENMKINNNDYVEIADGTYWVGFTGEMAGFLCSPYLIVDEDEAVLIDSGSRDDFSTVMLKIMRTGTSPGKIKRLIYQHSDPDLCGNIPHMEAMIDHPDLKVLSHSDNMVFINYYASKAPKESIDKIDYTYTFSSGRKLRFFPIPYAHTAGNFITYDTKTEVLFSSDLFGSYSTNGYIYTDLNAECEKCDIVKRSDLLKDHTWDKMICPRKKEQCQLLVVCKFHKHIMPSTRALRYALKQIEGLDISLIAPQHGNLYHTALSRKIVIHRLQTLANVGIDQFFAGG